LLRLKMGGLSIHHRERGMCRRSVTVKFLMIDKSLDVIYSWINRGCHCERLIRSVAISGKIPEIATSLRSSQ
ncbi:hypothetical protein, partial [Rickettsia sp. TH2014]|uniref:hypothetical protein n=1 Tax=Rickettsia sp. TH2014 TaxID=1967503 RepID=UPI001C456782